MPAKAIALGTPDFLGVVLFSFVPSVLAVVGAWAFSSAVDFVRKLRFHVDRGNPRWPQKLFGWAMTLTAGALSPSALQTFKTFEVYLGSAESTRVLVPQGVVGFSIAVLLCIILAVNGTIACHLDFKNDPGRAKLLSWLENALGGGALTLVLTYVFAASLAR